MLFRSDLGLIRRTALCPQIANPIYGEIIPRELTFITQLNFESRFDAALYVHPDGRLDLPKLLAAFQQFFREHSESWIQQFDYQEAGPQLLMQAFLQRIVNHVLSEVEGSGGRVEREYGLGRRRTDLLVLWPVGGQESGGRGQPDLAKPEESGRGQPSVASFQLPASSIQRAVI